MPTLCTKTIAELKEMSFSIPSYQRGYRWRDIQVTQLLKDLWDFYHDNKANPDAWYCLQPLVVAQKVDGKAPDSAAGTQNELPCGHRVSPENATNGTWTVIDGQQRLTTLFIILKQLEPEARAPRQIEYETRQDSGVFLRELTPTPGHKSNNNPDFYCMQKAAKSVNDWLKKENLYADTEKKKSFATCICGKAKFIWYEAAEEDHYDVFTRLNSGKISLSNAELIKALLLRENRFSDKDGTVQLQQLEIAGEWDRIEQALGNDEFWYFINPDAEDGRFDATRIDFLFELVLRKGFNGQDPVRDYLKEIKQDPYFCFVKFSEFCKDHSAENPEKVVWSEIQSVFRRIKFWYDTRSLYHLVGFLMNRKGKDKEIRIKCLTDELLKESEPSEKMSRSGFKESLKRKCREAIPNSETFADLKYGDNKPVLNDVLLIFNLALLDRQASEQSRYPFHFHIQKKWSLEHIHAQKERSLNDSDMANIRRFYPLEISDDEFNTLLERDTGMRINCINNGKKLAFSDVFDKSDDTDILSGNDMLNSLSNLALLGGSENSALNNKMYLEKKVLLSEWEHSLEKRFIPLGTRMVFFKHFSPASTMPFAWTVPDGDNYVDAITKLIEEYLSPAIQTADKK